MKRNLSLLIAVLALVGLAVAAAAMPQTAYFCQDDFNLIFGEHGNALAANSELIADGRLLQWNENKLVGWFSLDAVASQAAQVTATTWTMTFDSGTFSIHSTKSGGTVYWQGTISNLTITGFVDQAARYSATTYTRPSYETEPTEFIAVGGATLARTGGTWTDPQLSLPWMGSYNWNYDGDTPEESDNLYGNLQAKLTVPEPAGFAAILSGLVGLAGLIGRKRR